jgi:hypothetical protein
MMYYKQEGRSDGKEGGREEKREGRECILDSLVDT